GLANVVRVREVKHGVAQDHQQLLVLAQELARERRVAGLHDDALANPLPELLLRRPELLAVAADDERVALPLLLLLLFRHKVLVPQDTRPPSRDRHESEAETLRASRPTPSACGRGNLSSEAASAM